MSEEKELVFYVEKYEDIESKVKLCIEKISKIKDLKGYKFVSKAISKHPNKFGYNVFIGFKK